MALAVEHPEVRDESPIRGIVCGEVIKKSGEPVVVVKAPETVGGSEGPDSLEIPVDEERPPQRVALGTKRHLAGERAGGCKAGCHARQIV